MNGLSILIGFAQMTLVLLMAGLIARTIRRIAPRTSASVGIVGLLLSFCLLLLTLVNVPRLIETQIATSSTVSLSSSVSSSKIVAPPATLSNALSTEPPASVVSLSEIAAWLGTIQLAEPTTTPLQQTITWLALAAVLSLGVAAITPLVIGLCFTIKLHRDSELIDDSELNHLLHDWSKDPIAWQFRYPNSLRHGSWMQHDLLASEVAGVAAR